MSLGRCTTNRWVPLAIAVLLAVVLAEHRPYARGNTPPPGAAVTFLYQSGDDLTNIPSSTSGSTWYVDGVEGVTAQLLDGSSGDLSVNMSSGKRRFNVTYTYLGSCSGPGCTPLGPVPVGGFNDGFHVGAHAITDMAVGETRITQGNFSAFFGTKSNFAFLWCDDGNPAITLQGGCADIAVDGSQMVSVTRSTDSSTTPPTPVWTINADPFQASNLVGDTSEVKEYANPKNKLHGLYKARFHLLVRCISGCSVFPI